MPRIGEFAKSGSGLKGGSTGPQALEGGAFPQGSMKLVETPTRLPPARACVLIQEMDQWGLYQHSSPPQIRTGRRGFCA